MIVVSEATRLADQHAARQDLGHEDYYLEARLLGSVPDGWLFEYSVACRRDIPLDQRERFAGAGGLTISLGNLEIRELTVPELIQAIQELSSAGAAF